MKIIGVEKEERQDEGPKEEERELLGINSVKYGDGEEEKKIKGGRKEKRWRRQLRERKSALETKELEFNKGKINFSRKKW